MTSTLDDGSVRVSVLVNGSVIKDTLKIVSIDITHEINKISVASITLTGTINVESASMDGSDGDDFAPGTTIKVTAGYGDKGEDSVFEGVIVKHGLQIKDRTGYTIQMLCKHTAVSMTFARKEAEFAGKTDDVIMKAIFGNYNISCTIDSTTAVNENLFQKLGTDWDVILSRAEFNGFLILLDSTSVTIGKPKLSASSVLAIDATLKATSFLGELSAERQPTTIKATAWDSKTGALLTSSATEPTINTQGSVATKDLSQQLRQSELSLNLATPMSTDELQTWANSQLLQMRLSAKKGKLSLQGTSAVKTGDLIKLTNAGAKFNGDAFLSSIQHSLSACTWNTTLKFGLDNKKIYEKPDFSYSAAGGQVPAVQGLQIGTVKKLSADPQSAYRIQVTLPSSAESPTGLWARAANFYATSAAGAGFMPEVGDEVVIGFLESDPRYPVILGSLYSAKNASPNPAQDENNYIKSITTKSKLVVSFDDEKKVIILKTPGGNTITISDDDKSIELLDKTKNSVKLSEAGIVLTSKKDLKLTATGDISIAATGKLSLDSKQDMSATSGMNILHKAQIGFTGKGTATAEVSATGQTTIKGGMVMIN